MTLRPLDPPLPSTQQPSSLSVASSSTRSHYTQSLRPPIFHLRQVTLTTAFYCLELPLPPLPFPLYTPFRTEIFYFSPLRRCFPYHDPATTHVPHSSPLSISFRGEGCNAYTDRLPHRDTCCRMDICL